MITRIERDQFVNELNTKIKELRNRWFFKSTNQAKSNKLVKVSNVLSDLEIPFYSVGHRPEIDFTEVAVAIKQAREKTNVFNYGKVGKFFAGLCMFSMEPKTKSDLLLDKIEKKSAVVYTP